MRSIRPALIIVVLSACEPIVDDSCRTPRDPAATDCIVHDGASWAFNPNQPLPAIDEFCAASCVDVDTAVHISGYDDLSKVPLLPKFRRIQVLSINIDTLTDLSGMESVDIVGALKLMGSAAVTGESPAKEFTSLKGLTDEHIPKLIISRTDTRTNIADSSLQKIDHLDLDQTGLETIDVSRLNLVSMSVYLNSAITHIRLGAGQMEAINLTGNASLRQLEWPADLIISKRIHIDANEALSTCLINDFVSSTDAGTRRIEETVSRNAPCP